MSAFLQKKNTIRHALGTALLHGHQKCYRFGCSLYLKNVFCWVTYEYEEGRRGWGDEVVQEYFFEAQLTELT